MRVTSRGLRLALAVAFVGLLVQRVAAEDAAETNFQRGYYYQTLKNDPSAAAKAFEQVLDDPNAKAELKADAETRLAQCREDLAAADLAQLLPADALAYLEINRPGAHVGNVIRMLGLMREPGAAKPVDEKTAGASGIPIAPGFEMPADFAVSPALVRELEKVRGVAVALTSIDQRGVPDGVAVIHPGESDLLRGLAETSIQFVRRADSIEGYETYQIENHVWLVQTARLFIVAGTKDQAAAAIARLKNPPAESLASNKRFAKLADDRKNALAFAYVAGDQIAPLMISHGALTEAMIARSVADLDKLESLVGIAKTTKDGIELEGKVVMAEGHRNLAYALIRTAPATRRTLANVPSGAAAVGILGLNPAEKAPAAPAVAPGEPRYISAMDLGREVFANIEEVSAFVMPSANDEARTPIPEVGLVFGVKDAEQSQALWDQLLALPSMFGAPLTSPPTDVTVEGQKGRQFRFPYIPPIVLVAQKDRTFIAGTHGAVLASLRVAAGEQDSIAKDAQVKSLIDALPEHTSKGAVVHVGRLVRLAAPLAGRDMPPEIATTSVFDNLTLSLVTDEQPTEFSVRIAAKGLPDLGALARMALAQHGRFYAELRRKSERYQIEHAAEIEAVRAASDAHVRRVEAKRHEREAGRHETRAEDESARRSPKPVEQDAPKMPE